MRHLLLWELLFNMKIITVCTLIAKMKFSIAGREIAPNTGANATKVVLLFSC